MLINYLQSVQTVHVIKIIPLEELCIAVARRTKRKSRRNIPDSKVYEANMGPTWDRQDPGGPHADPMNLAIWDG